MIDRDKIMKELISVFGKAWNKQESDFASYPNHRRIPGSRRKAGLNAVLDVLERDYIITERESNEQ